MASPTRGPTTAPAIQAFDDISPVVVEADVIYYQYFAFCIVGIVRGLRVGDGITATAADGTVL